MENDFEPLVSIIILNYNGGKLLVDCVESIYNSDYKNFEVIIVDNFSKDESHKECKKKFNQVILINNLENLGYCEGNNVGIRRARGDFLVILNPDKLVEGISCGIQQEWRRTLPTKDFSYYTEKYVIQYG